MEIKTLETAGFVSAFDALRLSYGKEPRSRSVAKWWNNVAGAVCACWKVVPDERDVGLMQRLLLAGDEHAKVLRGIVAWAKITAPVYWWCEAETYRAGHERFMSESTMHIDCNSLRGEELQKAKAAIPMGKELTKIDFFSYQALRNIYRQRKDHRLQEWHEFCGWIESLPMAEDLITYGL